MTTPANPDPSTPSAVPAGVPPTLPRLRFPIILLTLFWAIALGVGALDKPYFLGFFYGLASTALVTVLFLGWWWFSRGFLLREKLAGFVFTLGAMWLVSRFTHHSINLFTLWTAGLPLLVSLLLVWLFLARRWKISHLRTGMLVIVLLVWSGFLLIRRDGADSSLSARTHWRWTPTAEEQFLTQLRTAAPLPKSAPPNSLPISSVAQVDWLNFRGADREGLVHGALVTTNWTVTPPAPLWKHAVGPAWSSLIVVGHRLFTQEQRGDEEAVVCYDANTGAQIWSTAELTRFDEPVSGPGPRATPTFAKGRLYTLGGTGLLNCLEADTGRVVWKHDIKDVSRAKVPMWAFSSSPLVTDELVVVYAGGEAGKGLLAYRAASGELAWAVPAGGSSYSSPQLTVLAGVPQCLMLHDAGLTAVDLATGSQLWEVNVPMKGAPRCGQPHLVQGNKLLVAALGGLGTSLIEVSKSGDKWLTTTLWDSKDLKPEFPDFVVDQGYAYGFDVGLFCCLNLADGKRAWKEGRYGRGQVVLLQEQSLLLVSSETGELALLAADPTAHKELGRFQALSGKTWNHAVVRGDRVYHRNAEEMAGFSLADDPSKAAQN